MTTLFTNGKNYHGDYKRNQSTILRSSKDRWQLFRKMTSFVANSSFFFYFVFIVIILIPRCLSKRGRKFQTFIKANSNLNTANTLSFNILFKPLNFNAYILKSCNSLISRNKIKVSVPAFL